MVLGPATYIAVACHCPGRRVTLGIEIIVFFARAVDPGQAAQLERARNESGQRSKTGANWLACRA